MAGESQVRPEPDATADRSPNRAAVSLAARDAAHLWHPYTQMLTRPAPIPVVSGEGVYLFTEDGRRLLDGTSSWWLSSSGEWVRHHVDDDGVPLRDLQEVLITTRRRRRSTRPVGTSDSAR